MEVANARQESSSELPEAALKGDLERVKALLAQSVDIDLEARDSDGRTALMNAARKGHVAVAEALLQAKATLNTQSNYGATALIFAGLCGRTEVAALLLKAKADMTLKNENGNTALDLARQLNKTETAALLEKYEQAGRELREAAKEGKAEEVQRLLEDEYVPVDLPDQVAAAGARLTAQSTELHEAARCKARQAARDK
eukprot:g80341.t1